MSHFTAINSSFFEAVHDITNTLTTKTAHSNKSLCYFFIGVGKNPSFLNAPSGASLNGADVQAHKLLYFFHGQLNYAWNLSC